MNKILVLLLLHSFLNQAYSKEVATVKQVKGIATVLFPGDHEATQLKQGEKILEDSSIVTKNKSFVRLEYIDKSIVIIKPKTKIVIKETRKNTSVKVISLLKGRIRNYVKNKIKNKKKKMEIETHSALMGVRGTEFEALYNPNTNKSTLLTYSGEVEIEKRKSEAKNKKAVLVAAGFVSTVSEDKQIKDTIIIKEKLRFDQFQALKNNNPIKKTELSADNLSQETKSGWSLDTESGDIVPPSKEGKVVGNYDKNTGEYIPSPAVPTKRDTGTSANLSYSLSLAYLAESYDFDGNRLDSNGSTHSNLGSEVIIRFSYKNQYYLDTFLKYSKFDSPNNVSHETDKNFFKKVLVGYKFKLANHYNLFTEAGLQDEMTIDIYQKSSSSTYYSSFNATTVSRLSIGVELIQEKLIYSARIIRKLGGGENEEEVDAANAYELGIKFPLEKYSIYTNYLSEEIKSYYTSSNHKLLSLGIQYNF